MLNNTINTQTYTSPRPEIIHIIHTLRKHEGNSVRRDISAGAGEMLVVIVPSIDGVTDHIETKRNDRGVTTAG